MWWRLTCRPRPWRARRGQPRAEGSRSCLTEARVCILRGSAKHWRNGWRPRSLCASLELGPCVPPEALYQVRRQSRGCAGGRRTHPFSGCWTGGCTGRQTRCRMWSRGLRWGSAPAPALARTRRTGSFRSTTGWNLKREEKWLDMAKLI